MHSKIKNIASVVLLIAPMAVYAQSHGGGPPAGVGGGVSGAVGGIGHGSVGGMGGSIGGSLGGNASGGLANRPSEFMSRAELRRAEVAAQKTAAEAKRLAAAQAGAEHANDSKDSQVSSKSSTHAGATSSTSTDHANANASFGQSTATSAKTLKDTDNTTRTGFSATVKAGAKEQGKGDDTADDADADGTPPKK